MRSRLLTIAIPTYRRPEFLDKCLASVALAIQDTDVSVLVMDDSTDKLNDSVCRKYSFVTHIKNSENLGIDRNICACIENSDSKYVWLLGEDDLIRTFQFKRAYSILESIDEYPFVFANYSYITPDQSRIFKIESIRVSTGEISFKDFFEKHLWSAGFIGGCIINRKHFLKTDYKSFIGTYYAHVAGICLSAQGQSIYLISNAVVGNRVGNASTFTWSDDAFGVFQGWRALLVSMKSRFGVESYKRAYQSHREAHGYLGYKFLINKKADGLLDAATVQRLISRDVTKDEIFRIRLIAEFMPRVACTFLRSFYGYIRRQRMSYFHVSE